MQSSFGISGGMGPPVDLSPAKRLLEEGKFDAAIETLKKELEAFRSEEDKDAYRALLLHGLIEKGEYEELEKIAQNSAHSGDCNRRYALVLHDFKRGAPRQDVEKTLVKALQINNYVPSLLLEQMPPPPNCRNVGPGTLSEAVAYVNSTLESWKRVPGALDWLREMQARDGPKPDDDGSILFDLLQKGRLLIDVAGSRMEFTTRVDQMMGTGSRDFYMPSGMKDHNPEMMVVYRTGNERMRLGNERIEGDDRPFIAFRYDSVERAHFWSVLNEFSETFEEPVRGYMCSHLTGCFNKKASLRCSRCKVKRYCSKECQKKDWRRIHKDVCNKLIKN